MFTKLTHASVIIGDYDEAKQFYTEVLGFEERSDDALGDDDYRWITVAVPGQDVELVLHKPTSPEEKDLVGRSSGFVIGTEDCVATYETLGERGVTFTLEPEEQMWGIQAVFEDLYGNSFVLVESPA